MSCSIISTVIAGSSRAQQPGHQPRLRGREAGGGLVEQEHARPPGQGQRDLELALLAVGEVPHHRVAELLEPDRRERRPRPLEQRRVARRPGGAWRSCTGGRACTASRQFSSTVRSGKRLVIWNVRARPSAARRCGGSRVTSRPKSAMRPALTRQRARDQVEERGLPRAVGADERAPLARRARRASRRPRPGARRTTWRRASRRQRSSASAHGPARSPGRRSLPSASPPQSAPTMPRGAKRMTPM